MRCHRFFPLIFLILPALPALGQHTPAARTHATAGVARTAKPATSALFAQYAARLDSLSAKYATWQYTGADTLSNPYYFPLFAPPTFYSEVAHSCLGTLPTTKPRHRAAAIFRQGRAAHFASVVQQTLLDIYTTQPQLIRYNNDSLPAAPALPPEVSIAVKPEPKLVEKTVHEVIPEANESFTDDYGIVVRRPNFWNFRYNFSLHFMQNYISPNWHKGGENNHSFLAASVIEANYNNKQKLTLGNKLEMKLGFQSVHGDEEHRFKTNADQLRLTNKLGLNAFKNWYYTLMLQSWTQFYRGYKTNDKKVYSDFMSPFECLLSVGMDYRLSIKRFNLNATISPFAGKFKYVDRSALETSFGLTEGYHSHYEFGSNITMNYTWDIAKNVKWQGRIYYFTDYDKAQFEWENTFNLRVNQYLTTQLFVYPRLDDNRPRKEGDSYWQFYETLSLGLEISF